MLGPRTPLLISLLAAFAAPALGLICAKDGVTLAPDTSNDAANPAFLHPSSGLIFNKYDSPLDDATEAEMVALEFLGSYDTDTKGDVWVVTADGKGLAKLTSPYAKYFSAEDDDLAPGSENYVFDQTIFDQAIRAVRGNTALQREAREWADAAKAAAKEQSGIDSLDPRGTSSAVVETGLEARYLIACGTNRCHSQRVCIQTGGRVCNICYRFKCYYSFFPDGC